MHLIDLPTEYATASMPGRCQTAAGAFNQGSPLPLHPEGGPQYLSTAVIGREFAQPFIRSPEERNERAADLYRAVRTTRYGCRRDGSHAAYSRRAFLVLHRRYGDTPWARSTPYWFK